MSQYTTADAIVKQSLIETGSMTEHGYQLHLNYFFRVLKDLKLTTIRTVKTVCIPINPNMSIDLPTDSLGWVRVGILGKENCISELVQNPKMGLFQRKDNCGNPLPTICHCETEDEKSDHVFFWDNFDNIYWGLNNFGGTDKRNKGGYFRESTEHDQLFLDVDLLAKEIYLEYISDGVNETGETKVLSIAEESILAGIYMRKIMRNDKISQAEKERSERRFQTEKDKLSRELNKFTIRDYLYTKQKGYTLAPK